MTQNALYEVRTTRGRTDEGGLLLVSKRHGQSIITTAERGLCTMTKSADELRAGELGNLRFQTEYEALLRLLWWSNAGEAMGQTEIVRLDF